MLYIQLPFGSVKNNKQIQFNLPSDYEESQYYQELPVITNESPTVKNNLLNLLRNRDDLKKWFQRLVIMIIRYKKISIQQ